MSSLLNFNKVYSCLIPLTPIRSHIFLNINIILPQIVVDVPFYVTVKSKHNIQIYLLKESWRVAVTK